MGRVDFNGQSVVVLSGSSEVRTQVSRAPRYLVGAGKTSEDVYEKNCWNWGKLVGHHCECALWVFHFLSLSLGFLICEWG